MDELASNQTELERLFENLCKELTRSEDSVSRIQGKLLSIHYKEGIPTPIKEGNPIIQKTFVTDLNTQIRRLSVINDNLTSINNHLNEII